MINFGYKGFKKGRRGFSFLELSNIIHLCFIVLVKDLNPIQTECVVIKMTSQVQITQQNDNPETMKLASVEPLDAHWY